ncbi:MAG: restriction endonuclease subunit S [Phycisphaeraceae bacterium]|nr:restriction endonuclease subunit S [Phycisphaeraceae bacterium]
MSFAVSQTRKIKYIATVNDEALPESIDPDWELEYIDIGNVEAGAGITGTATYRFENAPSRARRRVRHGDVIISTVRTYLQAIAAIIEPPSNLIVSTGFAVIRPMLDKLDPGFCRYVLRDPSFLAEVERRSVGVSYPAINASDLAAIPVPFPPLDLQRAIADYLDRETAKLDAMVAAKERLLDLLAEKRRALITHAVTRGLNPTAPMKNSGIEWLGEIPKHWETAPLRYLVDVTSGSTPDKGNAEYWGGDIPWVSPKDMKRDRIDDAEDHVTELAMRETTLARIPVGSVLVVIRGMILAHSFPTAVTTAEVTINQDMKALRCRTRIAPEFLWAFFRGVEKHIVSLTDQSSHGTKKIDTDILGAVSIVLPTRDEQHRIVKAVIHQTAHMDDLLGQMRQSIVLLRERRAALIAAAVTGAIDVEAAA